MKAKKSWIDFIFLLLLIIPSFYSLFHQGYFSMHDDQHIARLYLLDKAIRQGYLYPRWVGGLGFNFGYPLFNFYPPLVYYIAEIFHLFGFSLIWSIKLTFVSGFIIATLGMFIFLRKLIGRLPAIFGAILYNYFFYHAITAYVRGALAEFFTMAIIPFILYFLDSLFRETNSKNAIFFGFFLALLILTHPLIAFPFVIYLSFFFLFYFFKSKNKKHFLGFFIIGVIIALGLSSFFWAPSMFEKKYTMVDDILTRELANYKIHYVYPSQYWYSPWGYGGSTEGLGDGITFQLGKIHITAVLFSFFTFLLYALKKIKDGINISNYYLFYFFLFLFSLFIMTPVSSFVWDHIQYLWYLQFPWRFFTFINLFISALSAFGLSFLLEIAAKKEILKKTASLSIIFLCLLVVYKYGIYFRPQRYLNTTDKDRTAFEEISWRISNSSFEFSPKGVKTKKSALDTSIFDIERKDITTVPYKIIFGNAEVKTLSNLYQKKEFAVNAKTPIYFQLNTFNFPGWKAYLQSANGQTEEVINDNNEYRLIRLNLDKGKYRLLFLFENTYIRTIANLISCFCFISVTIVLAVKCLSIRRRKNLQASSYFQSSK